jgi:hypothetical protein
MNQCPFKAPKSPLYPHLPSPDLLSLLQDSTQVRLAQKSHNLMIMNQSQSKHQSLKDTVILQGLKTLIIGHADLSTSLSQESNPTSAMQEQILKDF